MLVIYDLSMFIHGLSMIYPCLPIVYPLFIYDLSMLVIYDLSMLIHGLSMIYPWFVHAAIPPIQKGTFSLMAPNFTRSATRQIETCRYMLTTTCQAHHHI